jgi:hypothetical protein
MSGRVERQVDSLNRKSFSAERNLCFLMWQQKGGQGDESFYE